MRNVKSPSFAKVGDVVDYLRTKKEITTIRDRDLPKPIRGVRDFDVEILGSYSGPYKLAYGGSRPSFTSLYFRIDTVNVQAFIPLSCFNSDSKSHNLQTVTRRTKLGEKEHEEEAAPITQDEYLHWTKEDFETHNKFSCKLMQAPRLSHDPFKIGDDEYFEARREFGVYGDIYLEFQKFPDPIQKSVLGKIAEKNGIEMAKPPSNSGRGIEMAARWGGMLYARYAANIQAGERARFRDNRATAPLTKAGIDAACETIKQYDSALKSGEIISLQEQYKNLDQEIKALPRKALEYMEKM